jgi:hypothetical protein
MIILYILLALSIMLHMAVFAIALILLQEFKGFEELSSIWKNVHKNILESYKILIDQYKTIISEYRDMKALFDSMSDQYRNVMEQYKEISKMEQSYRELCKECVDRYSDSYEQFKLLTEKFDRIFTAPVCSCGNEEIVDDTPIGGFHDD